VSLLSCLFWKRTNFTGEKSRITVVDLCQRLENISTHSSPTVSRVRAWSLGSLRAVTTLGSSFHVFSQGFAKCQSLYNNSILLFKNKIVPTMCHQCGATLVYTNVAGTLIYVLKEFTSEYLLKDEKHVKSYNHLMVPTCNLGLTLLFIDHICQ
jgi:hypothetical protein